MQRLENEIDIHMRWMDVSEARRKSRVETIGKKLDLEEICKLKFLSQGDSLAGKLQACADGSTLLFEISTNGNDEHVVEGLARVGRLDLAIRYGKECSQEGELLYDRILKDLDYLEKTYFDEFRVLLLCISDELTDDDDLEKLKSVTTNIPRGSVGKVRTVLEFFTLLIQRDILQPKTLENALLEPMAELKMTSWLKHSRKISGFKERLSLREAEETEGSRVSQTTETVPKEVVQPSYIQPREGKEETNDQHLESVPKEVLESYYSHPNEIKEESNEQHLDIITGFDHMDVGAYCRLDSWPPIQSSINVSFKTSKHKVVYQRVEHVRIEEYRMTRKPRGKAVIFNIEKFRIDHKNPLSQEIPDRRGSSIDADGLERIFGQLHFEVERYNDCTFNFIDDRLRSLGNETDHSNADCIVIFILTHGQKGRLLDVHGTPFDLEPLRKYFNASNCMTLAGKPKMFFIQACMGPESQGIYNHLATDTVRVKPPRYIPTEPEWKQTPDEADFLVCFPAPPGYVSYRDEKKGSWFISTFIETLHKNHDSHGLMDILTRTNSVLGEKTGTVDGIPCAQTLSTTGTLRRKIVFRSIPDTK
ncbi:caspase-2-like [Ylistrum balloti]|uniref:caspase-2-like n=1 Tax=Ylistrum balloti TaxID=509963 RepID=UPI0029058F2E|nr:caspase-2-like [Ylistrum balloti]